ncbi:hypothetical protein DCC85_12060 [Paenibacillus sp. CAA11]|nr:hypothetical protein DCC85_12060 [Paenibacillus sp. CAA11]
MTLLSRKHNYNTFFKMFYLGYAVLMLVSYSAYAWMDHHRMNLSQKWLQKSILRPDDIAIIHQNGQRSEMLQLTFLAIFLIAMCIILIWFRNNRVGQFVFFIANAILFIVIIIGGYIFSLNSSSSIGNLFEPLITPTCTLIGLLFYLLLVRKRKANV